MVVQRLMSAVCGDRTKMASWTFPPTAVSVRRARHEARTQMERWGLGRQGEVVKLLVSELVTNAIRHGRGQIRVTMSVENGVLRCGVEDESAEPPRMRHVGWDAERAGACTWSTCWPAAGAARTPAWARSSGSSWP